MKRSANLIIGLAFVVSMAVAGVQGARVSELREAEDFYRWMMSIATQARVLNDLVPDYEAKAGYQDEQLFARLVEETESLLKEDIPPRESDYDPSGKPFPKIVRYMSPPESSELDSSEERGSTLTKEQIARDEELWDLAQGSEMAELRSDFLSAKRDNKLYTLGTGFTLNSQYDPEAGRVSLANIFLGFRKMAANLLWLKVDTFWHQGYIHRMIPLMNTTVTLDPNFVDAFLLGAWHLAYNASAPLDITPYELREYDADHQDWVGDKERLYYNGVDFLKDGIRKNPRDYRVYFDLGYAIYEEKLQDRYNATRYLSEAIRLEHDVWVRRMLYRLMGEHEQFEDSKAGWEDYLTHWPDNEVAPRFIRRMDGRILERASEEASARADAATQLAERYLAAGDAAAAADWAAKAEEAQAEADRLFDEAQAFWNKFAEDSGGKEIYAVARGLRAKALKLRDMERYYEAVAEIDRARWASDAFWEDGTNLMLELKLDGGIPLEYTELAQLRRVETQELYTMLLPRSVSGRRFEYRDGKWTQRTIGVIPVAPGENIVRIQADSIEELELVYDKPAVARFIDELPGDKVFQQDGQWYAIEGADAPEVPDHILQAMGLQ